MSCFVFGIVMVCVLSCLVVSSFCDFFWACGFYFGDQNVSIFLTRLCASIRNIGLVHVGKFCLFILCDGVWFFQDFSSDIFFEFVSYFLFRNVWGRTCDRSDLVTSSLLSSP